MLGHEMLHASIVIVACSGIGKGNSWEVVNLDAVSGPHIHDPGVWIAGKTSSFDECKTRCATNASCISCDWAGNTDLDQEHPCTAKRTCYFRADAIWMPHRNGKCNHTSGLKSWIPTPPPTPPRPTPAPAPTPVPPPTPVKICGGPCGSDADCMSTTAT